MLCLLFFDDLFIVLYLFGLFLDFAVLLEPLAEVLDGVPWLLLASVRQTLGEDHTNFFLFVVGHIRVLVFH